MLVIYMNRVFAWLLSECFSLVTPYEDFCSLANFKLMVAKAERHPLLTLKTIFILFLPNFVNSCVV
jgi:hypothetical protein